MKVMYDPDFDDTCCIIDNEWSKKRKKREINFYAEHSVKRVKLEEEGIICSYQQPPAGTREVYKIGITEKTVEGIVPHSTIGQDAGKCEPMQPNVWNVFTKPLWDKTTVPIKGYNKYLTDPDYVKLVHSKVIGLMKKWQKAVCVAIRELQEEWNYPFSCVENQYTWACNKIDSVMNGLQNFRVMPVSHMNIMSVVELVRGIDDEEQADFAVSLARCQTVQVAVVRHLDNNDCSVVTIFDNSYARKVAYGKGSFPDFSEKDTVYNFRNM
jgi:hypothetical protein